MDEIPLFPLQLVLFPGNPLRLHIFEERYKRMINLCIESGRPFGVVLIRRGREALGPLAEPYRVGTSAKIDQVQRLEQGRMNILATGIERFRVLKLDDQQPYWVGEVERFPLTNHDPAGLLAAGAQLHRLVTRYLHVLEQAGKGQLVHDELPGEPVRLAYLAGALIQAANEQKQVLLESRDALDLVQATLAIYRRELILVQTLLHSGSSSQGSFSRN